ncbi:Glycosyltransferase involved in cell wall bisynthesis [Tangfeifania diversioriginum]|uniref:Glycosyltransferase involved in cell wall bisynthesis n=1 Tax=Tangfeifania diversioriginum TaxID=1168035 RepID=A0A1M6MHU0_9BACT|nr:glycosyltransferase family 4 protein [Tangfeifania diversioriginum]SHJ83007.1 Glycosyltransferase involved in cell wall bisynthesis [Tangfeifania diversioriginum]
MKHILHINSYYITNKLHSELVKSLDKKSLKQTVFIPVCSNKLINANNIESLKFGKLIYSKSFNSLTRLIWPVKMLQIWASFQKTVKKIERPNIIHAHSLIVNGLIAWLYSSRYNIPFSVSVRNTDINVFLKRSHIFRKLAEKILLKADSIMFLSPAYRDVHLKRIISDELFTKILPKTYIIPNGIDSFWIENSSNKTTFITKNICRILFSGRIDGNKNLKGVIEACNILTSKNQNIEIVVVGDGPLLNDLKKKNYSFKVTFHGYINEKEKLKKIYRSCQILVVPSFHETFGLIYPEAMTQGLPVIYSNNQGIDGYFPDGHVGYAVSPKNSNDIAKKIEMIITDYKRISKNANYESQKFSWDLVSNYVIKMYKASITSQ